jgi:hypothetical protein
MGYRTQSTPFQASLKQGVTLVSEVQPGKFIAMLGVLWFQSPKMARKAFTAAEYTVQHYSHVCNILEDFKKTNSKSTNSGTGVTITFLQLKK